jgi:hypothetical protein
MKIARVFVAPLLLVMAACASKSEAPEQDKGLEGTGVGAADSAPDKSPYGDPYPTDNIGTTPRQGDRPGSRIQNFKFLGYPSAPSEAGGGPDTSKGLQPISLANYFDPKGEHIKIIHIQASGVWCSACQAETEVVVPMAKKLAEMKAVWLVSLAEGPTPGTPSSQKDLDGWIAEFKSPYTHWLDPKNKNLGPFYDATALPWNANIDATTMEILTSGTGAVTSEDGIVEEIDKSLALASKSTLRK